MTQLKILFLALVLVPLITYAQTISDTIPSPYTVVQHAFGGLDPQYMPEGILFHAVVPLEQPLHFGGHAQPHPELRLSRGRFGALAMTLQSAVRDLDRAALFDTGYVRRYEPEATSQFVHYAGLHVRGGIFHDDALDRGQIAVAPDSTGFVDGPNIGTEAYIADTVFAFSALADVFTTRTVTHVFNPDHFYGNLPWGIPLQFDPGDGGGFLSIQLGDSVTVTYSGVDTAKLELRYTNAGTTYRAYSCATVKASLEKSVARMLNTTPQVFEEVPGVSIEVAFADPDCPEARFSNALIVVDGIDPTPEQNVNFGEAFDKYREFFLRGDRVSDLIADEGYDFIFINPDDGGQTVEDQAQLVKAAIRWINDEKRERAVAGDNIVIGHSMGGLTAKWALSEMARDKEAHGVSEFFSFDSPLRGAVIPYGLQAMLQYLINYTVQAQDADPVRLGDLETLKAANAALNTPAAKELLIYSVDAEGYIQFEGKPWQSWGYGTSSFALNTEIHDAFQDRFDALPPLDVPHYAIANGSRSFDQLSGTTDLGDRIQANGLITTLAIDSENCEYIWDTWPNCSSNVHGEFEVDATVRYAPGGSRINTGLEFYWNGVRVMHFEVLVETTHDTQNLPYYDLAPGALGDDGIDQLRDAPDKPQDPGTVLATQIHTDHFAFVPTSSALNLPIRVSAPVTGCGPGITECITPENRRIASRSFVSPTANHEHVTFTPQIASALIDHAFGDADLSIPWAASGSGSYNLNEAYNFGRRSAQDGFAVTPRNLTGNITVGSRGRLYFNRSGRLGLARQNNPYNTNDHQFDVMIGGTGCDETQTDVDLQYGSLFRVGDHYDRLSKTTIGLNARVRMRSGSYATVYHGSELVVQSQGPDGQGGLIIESGATLKIDERANSGGTPALVTVNGGILRVKSGGRILIDRHSQLQVRNGGRLILEDGATVEFKDSSNPNESEGVLYVGPGGKIELQSDHQWSGPGYLHFNDANPTAGSGTLVLRGGNNAYRRLKTSRLATLAPGQNLDVRSCRVDAAGGGIGVREGGTIRAIRALFEGGHTALTSDGTGSTYLRSTNFVNGFIGFNLHVDDPSARAGTQLLYCDFVNMDGGAILTGPNRNVTTIVPPTMRDCDFVNCLTGVEVFDLDEAYLTDLDFSGVMDNAVSAGQFGRLQITNTRADAQGADHESTLLRAEDGRTLVLRGGRYTNGDIGLLAIDTDVEFSSCVEFSGHGSAGVDATRSDLLLAGATIVDNRLGIEGEDITVTRQFNDYGDMIRNTFGRKTGPGLPYLFSSIRHTTGNFSDPLGTEDFTNNAWRQDGQAATVNPYWFCSTRTTRHCAYGAQTGGDEGGCGSECDSPSCPGFCAEYPSECEPEEPDFPVGPMFFSAASISLDPRLYPNPAAHAVTVDNLRGNAVTVLFYAATGSRVLEWHEEEATASTQVDVSQLQPGSYTVEVVEFFDDGAEIAPPIETHTQLAIIR